jgi:hypothetical protein
LVFLGFFEGMILMQPFLEPAERLMLIRDGLYSGDAVVRKRASLVLALDRGSNFMRVARSANCHRNTVKYWYLRYLERRTPAALRHKHDPTRRYEDQINHAARARALVVLAESRGGRRRGRLPWTAEAREQVAHDARSAADPSVRYRQAMRFALDRGASMEAISRAASCWKSVVNDLLSRELTGVSRQQRRYAALRKDVANGTRKAGCLAGEAGEG